MSVLSRVPQSAPLPPCERGVRQAPPSPSQTALQPNPTAARAQRRVNPLLESLGRSVSRHGLDAVRLDKSVLTRLAARVAKVKQAQRPRANMLVLRDVMR